MFPLISAIVLRRLLLAIPTLLLLSLVVFVVLRMLPVDPLVLLLPASATAADAAGLREETLGGLLFALVISVPGGVLAYALYQRRRETAADLAVALMQSIPSFL